MKRIVTGIILTLLTLAVQAQTMTVKTQQGVSYLFTANGDDMTYTDNGQTLTIQGKSFSVGDIAGISIDESAVEANTVYIGYNGTSATVAISGNVAQYVEATVDGAHVSINQTNTADVDGDEITYSLSGVSTNGSLTLSGTYKCTVALNGVTLTNPTGAAINIANSKRIQVSAKKGTENTLTDGANGSQKACLYSKGQIQLQGNGTLNVFSNTGHGIKSSDYIEVKNLTLNVVAGVKDAINCNEYFQMKSGTLSLTTTANGAKGLKSDSTIVVDGGTITINAKGGVDTSDAEDPSYVAGIACSKFVQNGGVIAMTIQGSSGRGIKADDVETNGGELTITNGATPTTISSDVKGAKGIKALNVALNAGTINITMSGNASKAIRCGDGTQTTSGGGGGWGGWGGPGGGPGGMGGKTTWSDITGSYTQGKADGTGPTLTISQTGGTYSSSSAKGIKAICAVTIYGGETTVNTTKSGGEGLESKTSVDIRGGRHYLKCYDDCINSTGKVYFNGGITVCYSTGNDAVDSNAGTAGAITIGNGTIFAYMTKGDPDEGLDCDNNNYIQITGTGIGISAGGKQSSTSGTISGAKQGYAFLTKPTSYATKTYYTLADAEGNNLVTYSFEATVKNSLSFITAAGMTSKGSYTIKSSTVEPTDATTAFHGLYLGSSAAGTTSVTNFTAK